MKKLILTAFSVLTIATASFAAESLSPSNSALESAPAHLQETISFLLALTQKLEAELIEDVKAGKNKEEIIKVAKNLTDAENAVLMLKAMQHIHPHIK